MQNGIIVILIGIVIILVGIMYAGDDFNFFNTSPDVETEIEGIFEEEGVEASKTPVRIPYTNTINSGVTTKATNEKSVQSEIITVTYTDDGFIPPVIEVRVGKQVHFINKSSRGLWITADNHPTAKEQRYPEFDQGKTVSNGETFIFVFTKIGVWGYKNLNYEDHLGAVSVIE